MITVDLYKTFVRREGQTQVQMQAEFPVGQVTALTGASGIGKTTVLRMIAGLSAPDHGRLQVGNHAWYSSQQKVNLKPQRRQVGFVFQDNGLFPHLNVEENIGFGVPKASRKAVVAELLELVRLTDFAKQSVSTLSGGQQQRVALARAFALQPSLVLLDEPFSALDHELRSRLRSDLKTVISQRSTTVILATHDLTDAYQLADQTVRMNADGTTDTVFDSGPHPAVRLPARLLKLTAIPDRGWRALLELNGAVQQLHIRELNACKEGRLVWLVATESGYALTERSTH